MKRKLMSKAFAVLCGAICITGATGLSASAYSLGDINDDGYADSSDASDILRVYALLSTGKVSEVNEAEINYSDVNMDGRIDASDASDVLVYYSYASTGGAYSLEDYYTNKKKTEETNFDNVDLSGMGVTESYNASVAQVGLKWNAVEGATGYYVEFYTDQYYDENGQPFKYDKYVETTQFTAQLPSVLGENNNYRYRIIPYAQYGDFEKVWSKKWYADGSLGTYFISGRASRPYNSIPFRINTAHLEPHENIAWYDVRNFTTGVNDPTVARRIGAYEQEVSSDVYALYVTDNEKQILDNFAATHFTAGMTNYDKTITLMKWVHDNVVYANGETGNGHPYYSSISGLGYADACINYKAGQCVQYNGIIAEFLAYLGYDVYMLRCYSGDVGQGGGIHFRTEVNVDGIVYSLETGESTYDTASGYRWEWFFDTSHALLVNRPN